MIPPKITFGSLFAGIGGFDLGLERAGFKCKWQVEKDDFCQQILAKHWPHVKRYGDIHDFKSPEAVDLICGGFPCQPFSVAGKQKGKRDDRYLWPEMFRVIKEARPSWVVCENVPGIIKLALDQTLSDLEGFGYSCQAFVIPACAVNADHKRERLWVVANSNSYGHKRSERFQQDNGKISKRGESLYGTTTKFFDGSSWKKRNFESFFCGRDTRIPRRMDRLRALGNAVVPQVVEEIGRMILAAEREWLL